MADKEPKDDSSKQDLRWLGAGVEFCGVIGLFCYFGYKLDKWLDCAPGMLIIGFLVSFVGMVYIFYKDASK
jgi:F0F1-type ATP synthase assembly protein I